MKLYKASLPFGRLLSPQRDPKPSDSRADLPVIDRAAQRLALSLRTVKPE